MPVWIVKPLWYPLYKYGAYTRLVILMLITTLKLPCNFAINTHIKFPWGRLKELVTKHDFDHLQLRLSTSSTCHKKQWRLCCSSGEPEIWTSQSEIATRQKRMYIELQFSDAETSTYQCAGDRRYCSPTAILQAGSCTQSVHLPMSTWWRQAPDRQLIDRWCCTSETPDSRCNFSTINEYSWQACVSMLTQAWALLQELQKHGWVLLPCIRYKTTCNTINSQDSNSSCWLVWLK